MKVTCGKCQKVLSVPDDKIPATGSVKIKCPGCKEGISVSKVNPLAQTQDVVLPGKGKGIKGLPDMSGDLDSEIDLLGEAKYKAFVADTVYIKSISPALKKLDYQINLAKSQADGYKKLQGTSFDLILINEDFDGAGPGRNAIIKYLEPMSMDSRRSTFIGVLSKRVKTLDEFMAFAMSVDVVFNTGDLSNFELLLRKSINDFKNKYDTYRRVMKELGRAF